MSSGSNSGSNHADGMEDDELFGEVKEDNLLDGVEDLGDEEGEVLEDFIDDILKEEDGVVSDRDEERALRYAVGDEHESKAAEFRMRSQDIDERQMDVPKPEAVNVEDEWTPGRSRINRVFLLAGGLLLLVIVGGVLWAAIELRHGDEVAEAADQQLVERTEEKKVDQLEAEEMVRKIDQVCRAYLSADSIEEKLRYVNHPEKVEPMMRDYYSRRELEVRNLKEASVVMTTDAQRIIFWVVACEMEKGGSKNLVIRQEDGDDFSVLWELDVIYQPMDPSEFVESRHAEVVNFRLVVEPKAKSGFYGYEFADYRKYRCFQLRFPNEDRFLWGYTEIGGEADRALVAAYQSDREKQASENGTPFTLGIRFPEDSQSAKCVHIERVLDDDWKIN